MYGRNFGFVARKIQIWFWEALHIFAEQVMLNLLSITCRLTSIFRRDMGSLEYTTVVFVKETEIQ